VRRLPRAWAGSVGRRNFTHFPRCLRPRANGGTWWHALRHGASHARRGDRMPEFGDWIGDTKWAKGAERECLAGVQEDASQSVQSIASFAGRRSLESGALKVAAGCQGWQEPCLTPSAQIGIASWHRLAPAAAAAPRPARERSLVAPCPQRHTSLTSAPSWPIFTHPLIITYSTLPTVLSCSLQC
jgi:hypothetical protein